MPGLSAPCSAGATECLPVNGRGSRVADPIKLVVLVHIVQS